MSLTEEIPNCISSAKWMTRHIFPDRVSRAPIHVAGGGPARPRHLRRRGARGGLGALAAPAGAAAPAAAPRDE